MRRSHPFRLMMLALFCLAGFGQVSWSAAPEILGLPKEATKDKADTAVKDGKEEPKDSKKEDATKDEAKKDEAKKETAAWEVPLLGSKKSARDAVKSAADDAKKATDTGFTDAKLRGDTAWMLTASAFVLLMLPGLALFYGGMVRKKNVLATMMQSYAAMAVVGLYWIVVGYGLAFGPSQFKPTIMGITDAGMIGWSPDLFCLRGIASDMVLPGTNITVYAHVMFQGMFAIITPALISGAIAERIRFWPFCIFMILWVTVVYCPLAHMVWAFDWFYAVPVDAAKGAGGSAIGFLGKMGALDFAGGTVVHIAAGTAGLACALVLRKRLGYPEHTIQPNSMVLTLIGAGLLWFGWFGFNGGSATASNALATSAFSATQAAAAAAGLSWIFVEWIMKGKPTALGLASGIVAGLVAVTPASGYVYMWGGAAIGLIAGVVCYFSVMLKSVLGYDDSLDAFGVHAIGGFLGAVLTGIFCYAAVNSAGADGYFAIKGQRAKLEELRAQFPDAQYAFDLEDASKKVTTKTTDLDKAGVDLENAQSDAGFITTDEKAAEAFKAKADEELKKAEADVKKAEDSKASKEELTKATEAQTSAKEAADKAGVLIDAIKAQKTSQAAVDAAKADEKTATEAYKTKSTASKRLDELDTLTKEGSDKDKAVKKAKTDLDDATDAYTSAADAARKSADKNKGAPDATTKAAFDKAKTEKDKKNDDYQAIAADFNKLKDEQKKLGDAKTELKNYEANASKLWADEKTPLSQFGIQLKAAVFSTIFAFTLSLLLAALVQAMTMGNFSTDKKSEVEGLDLTEHGEVGFDLTHGYDSVPAHGSTEPKAAKVPPGMRRFDVVVEGVENGGLMKAWSELCQPSDQPIDADFKTVYPYVTTVQGNRFRLRGGDQARVSESIQRLFSKKLGRQLKVRIEE